MKDWTTMVRRDFDCGAPEGQQLAAFVMPDECGTPDMFGQGEHMTEEKPELKPGDLMTQTEARDLARRLTMDGAPHIAVAVPESAWGGQERGWTVRQL